MSESKRYKPVKFKTEIPLKRLLLISFFFISLACFPQAEHFLHCLRIIDNDDIELQWEPAGNPGQFEKYKIYHALSLSATFNLVGSVPDYNATTFTHLDINPIIFQNYYYIVAMYGQDSIVSDTISSIRLRVIPTDDKDIARLNWNAMHNPGLPGNSDYQYIYRKYTFGNWELIDSITDYVYLDTIRVCYDSINYRIEVKNENNCRSASNVSGAWLNDLTQPPLPELDSVSLDTSGNALLGWEASKDAGTVSYIIYRKNGNQTDSIDIVYGIENTFYVDSTAGGCFQSQAYSIAAVDSCGNKSPYGINPQQESESMRNIYLKDIVYETCENSNLLEWTAYINMKGGLEAYEIYYQTDEGDFTLLDRVDSQQNHYVHDNLDDETHYAYFVRAVNTDESITSTSCIKSNRTNYPDPADFIYLQNVSVVDNDHVELTLFTDTIASSTGYLILRSQNSGGPFDVIDTVFNTANARLFYEDIEADFSSQHYYYRITVLDSCNRESIQSNEGRNILLEMDRLNSDQYLLQWNTYEAWDAPVLQYDVFRLLEDGAVEIIESLSPGQTQLEVSAGNLVYAYFVEAIEAEGNGFGFSDTSRSNHVILNRVPEILLPNAFKPNGNKQEFKPVLKFLEDGQYRMFIFDRWGQLIYESRDPLEGWDGRFNGEYVSMGTYICVVTYSRNGESIEKKGTITVVY